jgi:hypothetical protein
MVQLQQVTEFVFPMQMPTAEEVDGDFTSYFTC